MSRNSAFEDIRPYNDMEIPDAMQRLAGNPMLEQVFSWLFPDQSPREHIERVRSITSNREFQEQVMHPATLSIIEKTMDGFTSSGASEAREGEGTLYISNHRDIVLDATLLELVLFRKGLPTTEISFGSNLMSTPSLVDIGKSNKMFKVFRKEGNMRELVQHSRHLSDYIRDRIQNGISVWIAQHEGRCKDGNDITDTGLLKMLAMSGGRDHVTSLASLHIVPVAVSYEIEPCDIMKVKELYKKRQEGTYTKSPGEDLVSIVTGITQYKGRVHCSLCPALTPEELESFADLPVPAFFSEAASLINRRIHHGYKPYGTNYAACDLLSGRQDHREHYSDNDVQFLAQREMLLPRKDTRSSEIMTHLLRKMYANPVLNKEKL